jgi:hypothetical protein
MKLPEYSICTLILVAAIVLVFIFGKFSIPMLLASSGTSLLVYSITASPTNSVVSGVIVLLVIAYLNRVRGEGFNVFTNPIEISSKIRSFKEGFAENTPDHDYYDNLYKEKEEEEHLIGNKQIGFTESFVDSVFKNISGAGYTSPGFGVGAPHLEGFEDKKKSKDESKPAPTVKKDEIPMPFKLGEIPDQVKNGPHIDAGSTLMKAIQSLNPDQINAMTKDTQQLIDTQKSLMNMLGTMKPMMNDGKELMNTFQQMFGK